MMKKIGKLCLTILVASTVVYGENNFIGTWKLNVHKSKYDPGPMPKSATRTVESSDDGVKITVTGEGQNGTPSHYSYTAKYDGKDYPVTGANFDSVALKEVNANTHTFILKKDGKVYSTGQTVISNGGKTMTFTTTGTDAEGKEVHNVSVYDKQ